MREGFLSGSEKYPDELLEGRKTVEGNVIACLAKDILLIDETALEYNNFITEDGAFYFGLIKNIRDKGYNSLDETTILSNISDFIEIGFKDRGGWDTLQHLIDIINEKNWDTYIDTLYRENIILNLHNNGFNLLEEVNEENKKIIPIKLFRKMNSESVLDWYESKLSSIGTGYSSKILEEEEIEITDDFIQSCTDGLEMGVPFDIAGKNIDEDDIYCLSSISRQIMGLLNGTTTVLGGYSSTGKTTLWITIIMALLFRQRKILIISNEQKCKVFKMSFIVWILCKHFKYFNVTKKKLISGDLNTADKEYIKKAQNYWNLTYKGRIKFIAIPDADMSLVKKKVRENVLKYGYDTVLYDTLKIDFNDGDEQHFISLIKDSRELDKMAKKYDIIMLCSLQLAINTLGKLFLDASVLSMSKQIKEVLENLMLMRVMYPEELDTDNKKFYCRPFRRKLINDKWIEEPYEIDKNGVYRALFIDKCRGGENSSDTGVAHLLKFDGSHGIWKEECLIRPRHGQIV